MSFTNLIYHLVFPTKDRMKTIPIQFESILYSKIIDVANDRGANVICIGGMPEHVHILVAIPSTMAVAKFVQTIKQSSSIFIKSLPDKFPLWAGWSEGYGGFSVSWTQVEAVKVYILTQKSHHVNVAFGEEYAKWLIKNGVDKSSPYINID